MAKMMAIPPSALIDRLSTLGNRIDDIAPKMLNAGIKPLERRIRQNAEKHKETGGLLDSIKVTKAKKGKKGTWSERVTFDGYDKDRKSTKSDPRGVPHARKAMSLEYGTVKQAATPFIRPAVAATDKEVTAEMQGVFEREVSKT